MKESQASIKQSSSSTGTLALAGGDSVTELDARADAIRAHLRGLLAELESRWHRAFDWRWQLREHPWWVGLGLAASASAAVAGAFQIVKNRQRARRKRRFLGLLPRS